MTAVTESRNDSELRAALEKLESEIIEGLEYGFFELTVSGERIKDGKSRLTIRGGKSHRYVIPPSKPRAQ